MRILVTGGAGYVGAHACKALKNAGYEPVVFDNLVYGHRDFVKWGEFEAGDLTDRSSVGAVIKKYSPGAIMHFAAYAYVGESVAEPLKYYRNNVVGSLNLLEAAKDNGAKLVVFSSTCATYGIPHDVPITEDHPQSPVSPYGKTKLAVEQILKDFDAAYGIKSVSLRYFNAAGADPDMEAGEDHNPETHLIPLTLDAAMGRKSHITVFGTDYDTPDGTCIRDYIHVTDLADAHVKALKYLINGGQSTAFNLGTGAGYSVKEVINAAQRVVGRYIIQKEGKRRAGDPPSLVSASDKVKEALGWTPAYGEIDTIIRHAWLWHQLRFGDKSK